MWNKKYTIIPAFIVIICIILNQQNDDKIFIVTGCAGYIGSHAALKLLDLGHKVVGIDNLSRSSTENLNVLKKNSKFIFHLIDIGNQQELNKVFQKYPNANTVFHFAANAFAKESVEYPDLYEANITVNTKLIVDSAIKYNIHNFVYSSSCAVYGTPETLPITENTPTKPVSPYGQCKLNAEKYIKTKISNTFKPQILRYFNVVGADPQGRIYENPNPHLAQYGRLWTSVVDTILQKRKCVELYETNLDTADGTAVRDYVHVSDIVDAHIAVMHYKESQTWNVATGTGVSTLEFIEAARKATNIFIPICFGKQKLSYSPSNLYASNNKLRKLTGWKPTYTSIEKILQTSANAIGLQKKNEPFYDICIVGAGMSAAVLAERHVNTFNHTVRIIEKRDHIGGNMYDYIDKETGIRVSKYGVHLFHTKIKRVWEYIQQFSQWTHWEHQCIAKVHEDYVPVPVNIDTVNTIFKLNITNETQMTQWLENVQIPTQNPQNSEEIGLQRVGKKLYELIFKPYTIKQWNKEPKELAPSVLARIPVRTNHENRYFTDPYQGLPTHGYTRIFENMFHSERITVNLNTDYFKIKNDMNCGHIYFTGPVDAYFAEQGMQKLEYRSLRFERKVFKNTSFYQPKAHVNYPALKYKYTRAIEYKHLLQQKSNDTIVFFEYSSDIGEPYYPVPNPQNKALYAKYQALAAQETNVTFVGRLANYKYFNMDETIINALELFDKKYT